MHEQRKLYDDGENKSKKLFDICMYDRELQTFINSDQIRFEFHAEEITKWEKKKKKTYRVERISLNLD